MGERGRDGMDVQSGVGEGKAGQSRAMRWMGRVGGNQTEEDSVSREVYKNKHTHTMKNLHHIIQNQIHQLVMTFQYPRNCSPSSASQPAPHKSHIPSPSNHPRSPTPKGERGRGGVGGSWGGGILSNTKQTKTQQ